MQRRGRSRQVSLAALARKASEERTRQRWALVESTIAVEMRSVACEVPPSEIVIGGTSTLHSLPLQPETTAGSSNNAERHCPPAQHSNIIDLTGAEFAFTPQFELSIQEIDVSSPEIYTYPPSISPSPMTSAAVTPDTSESHTSDSYFSTPEDNSPSPPLTLLDHLHIAYALDDLPLAKMLLLKMTQDVQDITSRTDPRLDAVKPEDFDVAFLPKGGLMTPEDEARLVERQEKERMRLQKEAEDAREQARRYREKTEYEKREQEEKERTEKEERERVERERAWEGWVEGVWGNAKEEMEKMKKMRDIAKRRQEDARKARQEQRQQEDERRRVIAERRRTNTTKGSVSTPLPRISYAHLPTVRPDSLPSSQTELLYTLPNIPKLSAQRKRTVRTSVAVPSSSTDYTPSHSCSVRKTITPSSSLFFAPQSLSHPNSTSSSSESDVDQRLSSAISVQEVLIAMRGELFPSEAVQPAIQRDCSQHTLHGRTKSDDLDLGGIRERSKTPHHNLTADLISSSRSAATRRQKRDDALLADLLSTSNNQFGEDRLRHRRADKGKGKSKTAEMKKRVPLRMNSSTSVASAMSKSICADCSGSLTSRPSTMSSSSNVSRSGSWLSFMSSSSMSSVSTVPTTPSASMPGSSPPTKSSVRTGSVFSAWLKGVASQSSLSPVDLCPCDHLDVPCTFSAYRGIVCRLLPVGKDESPLPLDFLDATVNPSPSLIDGEALDMALSARSSKNSGHAVALSGGSKTLLHSVTHFLDVAKSFQSAYMHAAMFAAIASVPNVSPFSHEWDRENERQKQCKVGDHGASEVKRRLRPVGCRVDKNEVSLFTSAIKSSQQSSDADVGQPATVPNGFRPKITLIELFPADDSVQYIPMISQKLYHAEHPPRTALPNPLPFPIHFKPQRPLSGLPLRRWSFEQLQTHVRLSSKRRPVSPPRYGPNGFRRSSRRSPSPPYSSLQPILRPRFVGNPVYLRLKALQNTTGVPVTDTQVVELHEEGVRIKGGILGSGKEKVLGTAFEDVGRSRLGVDLLSVSTVQHRVTLPVNSPIPWWHRRDDLDNVQLRWEDGNVRRGRSVVKH